MLFNFVLAGTTAERLAMLDDALRPLFFGLRAAGHRVVAFAQRFETRPAVNLVVADGAGSAGGGVAARARAEAGKAACIGLLCVDDRDPQLRRIAETVDFVWSCAPSAVLAECVTPERQAVVNFGFHPALLGPRLERDPARRESGIILYGDEGVRPAQLADRLTQAGLPALFVRSGHFPDYIVTDLLSRAQLALVVRHDQHDRTPPALRIAKAIGNGAAVITEPSAAGDFSLAPYVVECAYDDMPKRCQAMAREEATRRGLDALERFQRETSMAEGLAAAIDVAARSGGTGRA